MKNKLLIFFLFTLSLNHYSQDMMVSNLEDFVSFKRSETLINGVIQRKITYRIKRVDTSFSWSNHVNKNAVFFDYLVNNFSTKHTLDSIRDEVLFKETYYSLLYMDSTFMETVLAYDNIVNLKYQEKDTVTIDEVLSIAVKFFSVNYIAEDGKYMGSVCTNILPVSATEKNRKPFIEAFCYSTIFEYYADSELGTYIAFANNLEKLYDINLGINKEERLLRAQGALYFLMKDDPTLKKALLENFKKKKEHLPFIIN